MQQQDESGILKPVSITHGLGLRESVTHKICRAVLHEELIVRSYVNSADDFICKEEGSTPFSQQVLITVTVVNCELDVINIKTRFPNPLSLGMSSYNILIGWYVVRLSDAINGLKVTKIGPFSNCCRCDL